MVFTPSAERQRLLDGIPFAGVATQALRRAEAVLVVVGGDFAALIELLLVGIAVRFGFEGSSRDGCFDMARNVPARLCLGGAKLVGRVGVEPTTY